MPSAAPTRRSVLRGATALAAAAVGGCTAAPRAGNRPGPASRRQTEVDLAVVDRALVASRDLLVRYAATVAALPDLGGTLGPVAAEHAAHVAALDATPGTSPTTELRTGAPPTDAPATDAPATDVPPTAVPPTAVPPTAVPTIEVPAAAAEALAALAAAERASAVLRVADLLGASPAVARLLASVAACQAAHAATLTVPR